LQDEEQAWDDLIRLTGDTDSDVRMSADHALGRVSIVTATEAETEDEFRKEIENAMEFFKSPQEKQRLIIATRLDSVSPFTARSTQ
jgi:HEAT repeat protein